MVRRIYNKNFYSSPCFGRGVQKKTHLLLVKKCVVAVATLTHSLNPFYECRPLTQCNIIPGIRELNPRALSLSHSASHAQK